MTERNEQTFEMQIDGFGQISPVGCGRAVFRQSILNRELSGPNDISPLQAETAVETAAGTRMVLHFACPPVELPDALPDAVKRRMPRLSGMFFSAVFEAVEDAFGAEQTFLRENPERVGLLVGTAFGALPTAIQYERRLIQEGPVGASPTLFAGSIQNAIAAQLSIALGIRGPTSTVTTMEITTLNVLQMAADWLEQDVVDHVVVAIGDEISEIHLYAMAHRIGIAAPSNVTPTEQGSNSTARNLKWADARLGEGVVSFVLSRTSNSACSAPGLRRGLRPYPRVSSLPSRRTEIPNAPRILISPWRGEPVSQNVQTHIDQYGCTPLGLAFELAAATCLVGEDHVATACVQISDTGFVEGVLFSPSESSR